MSTAVLPSDRLVLLGATWQTYERVLRAFDDRHLRMTFGRGSLEIMTLSHEHESYSYLLGRIVDTVTEGLGLPVGGGKSIEGRGWKIDRRGSAILYPRASCHPFTLRAAQNSATFSVAEALRPIQFIPAR
jgi:hypothetical protein